jgi:clan AA aspartic protease (TIGR02281 family)
MKFLLRRVLVSRGRFFAIGCAMVVLLGAGVGVAEIFKWKDDAGRLHFAQDLNQVPPKYRLQARDEAMEEGTGGVIQRYESRPAAPRPPRARARTTLGNPSNRTYQIRVQKTGNSMRVNVRLNDRVTAPFYIDTGASDVSLPEWVARELGLDLEGGRTALYSTANGTVQSALVTLDSVELGGARVENVPAHISKTMSVGLLGLSFFNHFNYRVDPASGIVTLSPNGLAESGQIRGGRSAGQWKGEFARLARRRARIEEVLDEAGSNRARRRAELKEALEEVDRQRRLLEDEADDARVPMQWRD